MSYIRVAFYASFSKQKLLKLDFTDKKKKFSKKHTEKISFFFFLLIFDHVN